MGSARGGRGPPAARARSSARCGPPFVPTSYRAPALASRGPRTIIAGNALAGRRSVHGPADHEGAGVNRAGLCILALCVLCPGPGCDDPPVAPPPPALRAVVYAGPGTWRDSIIALRSLLSWMGIESGETDGAGIRNRSLAGAQLLCVPGGNMFEYAGDLGDAGVQAVRDFVAAGGGYVGVCGGAYFSATSVVWQGRRLAMQSLGLFDGASQGPLDAIAPYPECTMCEVQITDHTHAITREEPAAEWILYCYGPSLNPTSESTATILARYGATKAPAALAVTYGSGRAFLIGTHPEIEEDDDRDGTADSEAFDDRGSDWPLLRTAILWCVGN